MEKESVDNEIKTVTKLNEDKLKFILLKCTNCNERAKASERDSNECPKCQTKLAFSCEKCTKQLTDIHEALSHVDKNCEIKFYSCNDCNAKYSRKYDLQRHIIDNHDRAKPVECSRCLGVFKNKKNLKEHLKICNKPPHLLHNKGYVASKSTQYCPRCGKTVDATGNYNKKMCVLCNSPTVHQCNKCNYRFKSYTSFKYHLNKICFPRGILSCNHCDYTSQDKNRLRVHIINKHLFLSEDAIAEVTVTTTNKSGKKHSSEKAVKLSLIDTSKKTTRSRKPFYVASKCNYYCPQCKGTVDVKGIYNKKQCMKCNTRTLYQCKKCNHQSNAYTSIVHHVNKVCYPKLINFCADCDYSTPMKHRLRRHIVNKHLFTVESGTFQCGQCRFTTNIKSTFKLHVDNHVLGKVMADAELSAETIKKSEKDKPSGSGKNQPATNGKEQATTSRKEQPTSNEKEEPTTGSKEKLTTSKKKQPTTTGTTSKKEQPTMSETARKKEQPTPSGTTGKKERPTIKIDYCVKCSLRQSVKTDHCPNCKITMKLVCHICLNRFRNRSTLNRHLKGHEIQS